MYRLMIKQLAKVLMLGIVIAPAFGQEPELLMWDAMVAQKELPPASGLRSPDDASSMLQDEEMLGGWDYTRPVEELDGKFVKLPGFIVPLESDEGGMLSEFLLVPYYGACIHVPPPPPNQIVYVTLEEPYELTNTWDPYWIIGEMQVKPYFGQVADSVYRLAAQRVEKYEE